MNYRMATQEDARILFEWRNDDLTRSMFLNGDPVPWDSHVAWLGRRLAMPVPHLYILLDQDIRIGTFRIDEDEISYTISPLHRGKGLATTALKLVRNDFGMLIARIKSKNIASIKAAKNAGMIVEIIPD